MKDEQLILEYISRYIRYGFYRPLEVEQIVGEDVFGGKIARKQLRVWVKQAAARQTAEEETWPAVTDCDRLDRAFTELRAEGILALHNAGNTPSEGIDEMSEQYHMAGGEASDIIGYCFYHRQDMEQALMHGKLGVAYGDIDGCKERGVLIGQQVQVALEESGLQVEWTGSINDKMFLTDFRWQRRMPT